MFHVSQDIEDLRYRTLSFFFMAIMAALTLVVQGTTTAPLLQVQPIPLAASNQNWFGCIASLLAERLCCC